MLSDLATASVWLAVSAMIICVPILAFDLVRAIRSDRRGGRKR
jgi:hypothetical protein